MYVDNITKFFYSTKKDNKTLLKRGYMNVKTIKTSLKFESYYIHLIKAIKNSKFYLEFYKDEFSKKLIFLIDMNRVDQINLNLKDKPSLIYLKGNDQICILSASSSLILNSWLDVLCKSCGFINHASTENNNYVENNINISCLNDEVFVDDERFKKSKEKVTKVTSCVFSLPSKQLYTDSEVKRKSIAGNACFSVGSIDLVSNPNIEQLFDSKINCELEEKKGSYLNLDDFISGQDDLCKKKSILIEPPFKLASSSIASSSTSPSGSIQPLDRINNSKSNSKSEKNFHVEDKFLIHEYQNSQMLSLIDSTSMHEKLNNNQNCIRLRYVELEVAANIENNNNNRFDEKNITKTEFIGEETNDINNIENAFISSERINNNQIGKRLSTANDSLFNSSIKTDFSDQEYTNLDLIKSKALKFTSDIRSKRNN